MRACMRYDVIEQIDARWFRYAISDGQYSAFATDSSTLETLARAEALGTEIVWSPAVPKPTGYDAAVRRHARAS